MRLFNAEFQADKICTICGINLSLGHSWILHCRFPVSGMAHVLWNVTEPVYPSSIHSFLTFSCSVLALQARGSPPGSPTTPLSTSLSEFNRWIFFFLGSFYSVTNFKKSEYFQNSIYISWPIFIATFTLFAAFTLLLLVLFTWVRFLRIL